MRNVPRVSANKARYEIGKYSFLPFDDTWRYHGELFAVSAANQCC